MTRGVKPLTHTAPLEDGAMIAAWMVRSGQPVDPVYNGGPQGTLGRIHPGVQLTLADEQGRMITRTLDGGQLADLITVLQVHRDNIAPRFAHPPRE